MGDVTSTSTQSSELLLILEDDEDDDTLGVIIEVVKVISVASEMNISIRQ